MLTTNECDQNNDKDYEHNFWTFVSQELCIYVVKIYFSSMEIVFFSKELISHKKFLWCIIAYLSAYFKDF